MDTWDALSLGKESILGKGTDRGSLFKLWGSEKGIKVLDWQELLKLGEEQPREFVPPKSEDEHSIW
jgi:hypothetical protein